MSDGGAAGGCTGSTGCCIPTCDVMVTDSLGGGDGVVRWTGTCQSNEQNPSGTQDVGDGHQMTWLRDESGQAVIDVFRKSDKKYDRWTIKGCSSPGAGGSQCSPTGGGCVSGPLGDISYCINTLHTERYCPSPLRCPGLKHRRSDFMNGWREMSLRDEYANTSSHSTIIKIPSSYKLPIHMSLMSSRLIIRFIRATAISTAIARLGFEGR
jgi:hypothetical protein